MIGESLTGSSLTAEEVFNRVTQSGVEKSQAATLVARWILANAGATPRTFAYQTSFAGADPTCVAEFTRSFVHLDWTDGEDMVQAGETTGEEGFNLRFHRIEGDLDSLGRDVARAFLCLAGMRSALRSLLDEIGTELNYLNRTIAECCARSGGPLTIGGVVGGQFIGQTKFFDKDVQVFQSERGVVLLPAVTGVVGDPVENQRIKRVADMAAFATADPVKKFFTDHPTPSMDDFVREFGNQQLDSGMTVRDAVAILPGDARFDTADAMVEALSEREAAALRTSPVESAIAGLIGGPELKPAETPIGQLSTIPSDGLSALKAAGVNTIGDLTAQDPTALTKTLRDKGVSASLSQVSRWTAMAKLISRLG
jgi:hypothetical protein